MAASWGWSKTSLRTTFLKIIARAAAKPWPRLFHNLRASRETELAELFPLRVVYEWIGDSKAVAYKHYLMTTEDHFKAAIDPVHLVHLLANPVRQCTAIHRNAKSAKSEEKQVREQCGSVISVGEADVGRSFGVDRFSQS